MGKMMETVLEYFDSVDWIYEEGPDGSTIELWARGHNGEFPLKILVDEEQDVLVVSVGVAAGIPGERRGAVCEFLVRHNWYGSLGCLQMDLTDGEVTHRTMVDVEDGELSTTMVANVVLAALQTVDQAYPGLMAVTFAGVSAAEAVETLELEEGLTGIMVQ